MAKEIIINKQRFSVSIDTRTNTEYIKSIHPYDETEYHWARKNPETKLWDIFRNGRRIGNLPADCKEKQVAEKLMWLDNINGLRPRICND